MNLLDTAMRIISFFAIYFFLLTENNLTPYGIFLASIIGFTIGLTALPALQSFKTKKPNAIFA